jgi:hypothetical protein
MQTCKTCRFWEPDVRNAGKCGLVGCRELEGSPRGFLIEATAADDWNLRTDLITGPDFGCVQHQPTDEDSRTSRGDSKHERETQ